MAQIRKKVQIKEKTDTRPNRWWLWLLLVLAIVIAVILFLWKPWQSSKNTKNDSAVTPTEEVTTNAPQVPAAEVSEGGTTVSAEKTVAVETPAQSASGQAASAETPATASGTQTGTDNRTTQSGQPSSAASVSGDVEKLAREVIRGNYGNGLVRKEKLGNKYTDVQRRVNEIYRDQNDFW
jgi:FtsZ-interacting cell division protein ZipA